MNLNTTAICKSQPIIYTLEQHTERKQTMGKTMWVLREGLTGYQDFFIRFFLSRNTAANALRDLA